MNEQKLIGALASINGWWNGAEVSSRIKKANTRRKIFYDLFNNCLEDEKNITCISGPRQVGKTTLMGQLIEAQINEKKIDQKRIIYLPLDNEFLLLNSDNILIDSINVYLELIIGESLPNLKEKVYIYLDEVQSLDKWDKQLKSYIDSYPNIKFIISGSSQTKLHNDASESLVGRIQFRVVLPFKFREFLEFTMGEEFPAELKFATVNLRDSLKKSIAQNDPRELYKRISSLNLSLGDKIHKIKKQLEIYLIKGGYPGALEFGENYDKALERIKTDLELTVFKDIHKIFKTRNSEDLMTLLTLVASSSGQKVNYSRLASSIGIDRRVVADYLSYTKLLYMTSESPFYQTSKYRQAEKMNKIYLVDTGQRNALVGKMNGDLMNECEAGLIIQTAVYNHASRLKFCLTGHSEHETYYWENQGKEVDVVIDLPLFVLPIESKSKNTNGAEASIKKFIDENKKKTSWGMVINNDELKLNENVLYVPLWAFLFMC
jgi:uncharacterized protein